VTRWRRPGASELLLLFLVLAAVSTTLAWLLHGRRAPYPLPACAVLAFLTWRVSRGGRLSHGLLLLGSAAACGVAAMSLARSWDRDVVTLLVLEGAKFALLLSPPVHGRTDQPRLNQVRLDSWASLLRRPPAWLLLSALLAGAGVTMACLGHMDWGPVAGCRPAGSDPCMALSEGYPLRWLTARGNAPVIAKAALLRDFVQWSVVSGWVLYLGWLGLAPSAPGPATRLEAASSR